MKACSFVFVIAVAILALANAESLKEKFQRFHNECHSANALTPHILCMNVKIGAMKPNGDIDRNGLKAALKILPSFTADMVDDAVAECGERRGSTAADAAQALDECMRKQLNNRVARGH